jgi:hypothetical protein
VSYKQEFLNFLKGRNEVDDFDLSVLNEEPSFYLIREPTSNQDYDEIVKCNIQNIFSSVYEGFSERTYTVSENEFELFFDIGCNEMVRDLSVSNPALGYENFK